MSKNNSQKDYKKDISFIISEIMRLYNFKTKSGFAEFLGIKPQTLSTWEKRNSIDYDLIYSKCENIDANWLLSGKGGMIRVGNITQGDRNAVSGNQGTISGQSIGDNSINISGPTTGKQKIIHPDKTIEINQSAQDTISHVAESQAPYMNASDTIAYQKEIISELQTEIIRLQKILINRLESDK